MWVGWRQMSTSKLDEVFWTFEHPLLSQKCENH